jgi:hypothetical protein
MRRRALHITVALAAFASGLLLSGERAGFATAVPLALLVFGLLAFSAEIDFEAYDFHTVKVWALTLVLWTPVLAFFLAVLSALGGGSCVGEPLEDEAYSPAPVAGVGFARPVPPDEDTTARGLTILSCDGRNDAAEAGTIWAGMIDRKALSKPTPTAPPDARGPLTVAVNVLVDESGRVTRAQALAGHPLLRHAAVRAACRARFAPTLINGPPVRVSGVLTYRF